MGSTGGASTPITTNSGITAYPNPNATTPTNWGGMSAGAGIGQGVMALSGAYNSSQAQKLQADFQKQQYEENAKIAGIQAQDAINRGDENAAQVEEKTKRMIGAQRVAAAASGTEADTGSAGLIEEDTKTLGALDAMTVRSNAWREAWGYKAQALQMSTAGQFAQMSGNNSSRNTLLTGGMQAIGYGGQAAYYYNSGGKRSKDDPIG